MRLGRIAAVVLGVGAPVLMVLAAGPTARAQTPTSTDPNPGWTCHPVSVPGQVVPPGERGPMQCETRRPFHKPPSPSPWPTLLAVVGWVFVPMTLAVWVAVSRDESVVIAVVLTLVLGWIGLLLVWAFLGGRRRGDAALRGSA